MRFRLRVGQTALTVTFLSEAVKILTNGSNDRLVALRGSVDTAIAGNGTLEAGSNLGVEALLRELQSTLAEEMALSLRMLRAEEEKAAAAAAAEVTF